MCVYVCVYLSVQEEVVKEMVDDVGSEDLDSNIVGNFLRFSLHLHVKCQNNGPPSGGAGRDEERGELVEGKEGGRKRGEISECEQYIPRWWS